MIFTSLNGHASKYFMAQCVTLPQARSKPAYYLSGQDQMGRIFMKISTCCLTRSMTLTMCLGGLRNFVSLFVTLEWQDLSFPRFTSTMGSQLMYSTTEY